MTVKPKTKAVLVLGEAEILHQLNSLGPLLERMGAIHLQMVPLISSMLQMVFSQLSLERQLTVAAVSRYLALSRAQTAPRHAQCDSP